MDYAKMIYTRTKDNEIKLIRLGFKPTGQTMYAWDGYSDTILGKAGGYGYDKASCALVDALEKIHGIRFEGSMKGIEMVMADAREKGYEVDDCMQVFWRNVNAK